MTIVYDENGNRVNKFADKIEEIKTRLEPILEEFVEEKQVNRAMKVKEKLGFRFAKQIFLALNEYPRMSAEEFSSLDYDDIENMWQKYSELTAYYNRYFEIVDNKQMFESFCGINNRQYTELENSDDEDIVSLMNSINSTFIGLGFVAGESGNADVKATTQRMRTKGEGHDLITASEDEIIRKIEAPSEIELMRKLQSVVGDGAKLLNEKKK